MLESSGVSVVRCGGSSVFLAIERRNLHMLLVCLAVSTRSVLSSFEGHAIATPRAQNA